MWCVCVWNYRRFASLDLTAFWRGGPMHWGRWHLQAQSCHGYYFCCVVWGKYRVCRAAFCVKLWMLGFDMSERMPEDMSESMWKDMSEDMSERVSKDWSERMSKDMVVVQNSFFSKRPFLAKKKFTLAKLSPYSQKTFAGPYVGLYLGIFGRKNTWQWTSARLAAAYSRVAFCFSRWSLLTFSGQFWHSHTETKGSLTCFLPLWQQDITTQQFRPPSFQEKAVFRQALSKLSPNFREKSPYINFIFKNPCTCHSYRTTFAKLSPKNNLL